MSETMFKCIISVDVIEEQLQGPMLTAQGQIPRPPLQVSQEIAKVYGAGASREAALDSASARFQDYLMRVTSKPPITQ